MTTRRRPALHSAPQASGPRTPRQRAGAQAEQTACEYLLARGCSIVACNQRFREGEIDVIARDGDCVVFVEVRLRSSARFGGAAASVDAFKQRRLIRAAQHWLQREYGDASQRGRGRAWPACRFDVIAVDAAGVNEWIRAAFSAD